MGLRAASVRRPNAVVMAPALTEAGQSQNFTLPPSSPINSVAQNGEYVPHEGEAKNDFDVKHIKCSYPGDSILNVTTNYLSPASKKKASSLRTLQVASDISHQLNIIMSTCPTPMGDQQDTMGLQKTGMDPMVTLLKDKTTPIEMEQLLNNLTSEIGGAGDITPQNVEDLMQAFKTMEQGGGDARPGEVVGVGDGETEAIFPELFGEVDMINMCEREDESVAAAKDQRAKEMLEELHKKQLKLERRSEFLLRRIRKVQARMMGSHVSAEVAGLYEHVHRTLRREREQDSAGDVELAVKAIGPRSVNSLVRKLHLSAIQQSTLTARQKHTARYFGSGSAEQAAVVRSPASGALCVPRLEPAPRDELERVAGTLHTQLNVLESQVDSDATASSSGAESCDEMQSYNNPHQHFLSISKRAAWRYATERASVAARWTWLQAQISDLEYRIRQHNELHRQIRGGKGAVIFGDPSTSGSSITSPSAVNGYRGQLPGAAGYKEEPLANGAVTGGGNSARTRPLHRASFRKRKLLQTTGLHTVSKKASRTSNIRCGCVPPVVPCALCTGRTDPTFPRDTPDQLTVPERIALLDPGYHPVLSFPDDISQSIHLEAIMKLPDWQQKALRCNLTKSLKSLIKLDRTVEKMDNRPKKSEHRKKYNRLLKTELKNKISRGRRLSRGSASSGSGVVSSSSGGVMRVHRKRRTTSLAIAQMHALASESTDELEALEAAAPGAKSSESLTPSPLSHVTVVPYRRNRVDSYDIDNIVIPYSVAASTRVEKLQYKEIPTPKWRVIDSDFPAKYDVKNNGIVRRVSEDSDVEDISEETILSRHDKCEHEEKKKFLSYIKFPLSVGRSRANRRTDSRAESSGANTPDPMSPAALPTPGDSEPATLTSPVTSPPATPLANHQDDSSTSHSHLRRRTVSQRCATPEPVEIIPPYDTREFPLLEAEFERMRRAMPEGHGHPSFLHGRDSEPDSPVPPCDSDDSTESVLPEEDPNDPEWEGCKRS